MSSRIACSDASFPLLPPEKLLDLVVLLELKAVDLGLFEGRSQLQPSTVFQNTSRVAADYRRQLQERGLRLSDVFLQVDLDFSAWAINHPDIARRRQTREAYRHALDFAGECNCHHVTVLPGVVFADEPETDSFQRCADELRWRCEKAEERGLVCSIEPHLGSIVPTPAETIRLIDAVPGLTLTLDYTHFVRQGFSESEIEPLVKQASHFHVRGANSRRLQASFKDNTIDYARVLKVMHETGYQGDLVLEYVWIDWEHWTEVDNLSETILWRDFITQQLGSTGSS